MPSFPQNKVWAQVSDRDVFDPTKYGFFRATAGVDTSSNVGRIRIAPRVLLNTSEETLTELVDVPVGFWLCGSGIYTIAGDGTNGFAFKNAGLLPNAFSKSTGGSYPTKVNSKTSDGVFGNNKLYVSEVDGGQVYLCKKVGDTDWGTRISMEGDVVGYPHMLWFFEGRIYMTNSQSKVISMDSSESVATSGANTIILNGITGDFTNVITRPFVSAGRNWLPCINTMGGKGHVYEWDGASTTYQERHRLNTAGALSGCDYHDIPYILDVEMNLLEWNGATFKVVASFARRNKKLLYNPLSLVNDRCVHPNGMWVEDDKIRFLVNGKNNDSTYSSEETIASGLYEYDPKHPELGIYNVGLPGLAKVGDTIKDYGAHRLAAVGGGAALNLPSTSADRNGSFLFGAKYYTNATTSKNGIFFNDSNDTLEKAMSFITLKMDSSAARNFINKVKIIHTLFDGTEVLAIKYRTKEEDPIVATITWTDDNEFTVANSDIDLTGYIATGSTRGFEVEILNGIGSNISAHITNAVLAAGTWTVTIDQSISSPSGTALARFQKWIFVAQNRTDLLDSILSGTPDQKRPWFQFKVWAKWTGKKEIERFLTDEDTALPDKLA